MRITGGEHRGRILEAPKGRDIRPTSDKVRLAIFNMLNARDALEGAVALDAFCGTGALGIEALSWGASRAVFLDKSRASLDLAKKNYAALKLSGGHFFLKDSQKPGVKPDDVLPATLVFLDPPYRQDLIAKSLPALAQNGWVAPGAFIVLESEDGYDPASWGAQGYEILVQRDYGDTRIALLTAPA